MGIKPSWLSPTAADCWQSAVEGLHALNLSILALLLHVAQGTQSVFQPQLLPKPFNKTKLRRMLLPPVKSTRTHFSRSIERALITVGNSLRQCSLQVVRRLRSALWTVLGEDPEVVSVMELENGGVFTELPLCRGVAQREGRTHNTKATKGPCACSISAATAGSEQQ